MSIEDVSKDVQLTIRVPSDYRDMLKDKALHSGTTMSKYLRECIERGIGIKDQNPLDSKALDYQKDTEVVGFRVSRGSFINFKVLCDAFYTQPRKAMRGFIDKVSALYKGHILSKESAPFFYLFLFVMDNMQQQGLTLDYVTKSDDTGPSPILDKKGPQTWQVFDDDHHVLWTLQFKKTDKKGPKV